MRCEHLDLLNAIGQRDRCGAFATHTCTALGNVIFICSRHACVSCTRMGEKDEGWKEVKF